MATVTIGKTYFEALLRRAEFHTNGPPDPDPLSSGQLVTLTQAEYETYKRQIREYATLRKALFRGGLTPETLDVLIAGADDEPQEDNPTAYNTWQPTPVAVTLTKPQTADQLTPDPSERLGGNTALLSYPPRATYGRSNSFGAADTSYTSPENNDQLMERPSGSNSKSTLPVHDRRTVFFTNLSDKTTHKDLTGIIRGGRLLDVYLRNDRSATVSFVEGAADFLAFARKNDFYLHTKRVEIRWNDRQFRLPPHVANKIAMGATRNIVIRNGVSKNLTEEGIREDMEHIHNLVVISVTFSKGDIYISTNSVHNALFARTCMMSRSLYKGLKIEWFPDECANALPRVQEKITASAMSHQQQGQSRAGSSRQLPLSNTNLFSMLDMDETEDSEGSEADEVESQALPGLSSNGVKINWADTVIAV